METKSLALIYYRNHILLLLGILLFVQCTTTKKVYRDAPEQPIATPKSVETLRNLPLKTTDSLSYLIEHNSILKNHFVGFVLHDLDDNKDLLSINGNRSFTPASNMKLYTLYTALNFLDDRVTAFEYRETMDSLIVRATGDPSFLDPYQKDNEGPYNFLKDSEKQLYLDLSLFQDERFGQGWAWDDFPYYYQAEKSAFPIYANKFYLRKESLDSTLQVFPDYFSSFMSGSLDTLANRFDRDIHDNNFSVNWHKIKDRKIVTDIPLSTSPELLIDLLSDTLNKKVQLLDSPRNQDNYESFEGIATDSLLEEIMIISDNFIAEQLLLQCSYEKLGYMKTKDIIDLAKEELFKDMPDEIRWVDGSGLSRYNLVTPSNNIWVLKKILDHWDLDKIKSYFPSGKGNDTLDESFQYEKPWIYAKTGSLSNNFNLSGYICTRSDKVLVFSFMNNHFMDKRSAVIREMNNILSFVRDNY